MAVVNYEQSNGHFPPAYTLGPDGRPWHSWRVLILPYIEGHKLYEAYRFDEPWDGPNNSRLADPMPKLFAFSRSDRDEPLGTTTSYLAVVGDKTMWPGAGSRKRGEITDGATSTILIVENNSLGVHWMEPRDLHFNTMSFTVNDPAGVSSWYTHPAVVTADDSVRRLSPGLSPDDLRALLTVSGGEAATGIEGWTDLPDGRLRERAEPK